MKSIAVTSGVFGGTVAARCVNDFCEYVESIVPESPAGKAIDVAAVTGTTVVKTGKAMGELKAYVEAECASSESCTAIVKMGSNAIEYVSVQGGKAKEFVSRA